MKYESIDPTYQKIMLGAAAVAESIVERARRAGTSIIAWRDNRIVRLDPSEFTPLPTEP